MEITLFTPHQGQKKIIDGFADSEHTYCSVACGRQFGKSLLAQNLLLYWLLSQPKQKGAWVSPIYNQAKKVFQELSDAANQIITHSNKADLTMTFVNGSTINFLSAERYDSIRGFSFNYIIVDECAYIKEQAMQEAIFPTLSAIGKKCLMISTPKSKNWFYNTYLKGLNEGGDYISFQGKSMENPHISAEFIAEQSKSLPRDIYLQEYEAQFSEATNDVFRGLDKVCILNGWTEPNRATKYYYGVDTGISNDYTVLSILDEAGRCVRILRFNGKSIAEAGEIISSELKKYNPRGGYVETNGVGRALYEAINSKNYRAKAFTTTQDSKTQGVRSLMQDIEDGVLELPSKELMPEVYNELSIYTYKISANGKLSFSHPNGMNDDIVDSLWLANLARTQLAFSKGSLYVGSMKPRFGS